MKHFSRNFFWMLLALIIVVAQGKNSADAAAFGTSAFVNLFDPSSPPGTSPFDVDDGQQTLSQAAIDTSDISAAAEAQLGLANLSPILKARSRLIDQSLDITGSAIAAALEQYTYVGTTTTTIEYNFTITGNVSTPIGATRDSRISSVVEFFVAPMLGDALFDIDGILPFITENLGFNSAELSGTVVDGVDQGNISFSVDPGDTFYMLADLFADSYSYSASADAFGTFTGSFVDTSQLRTASQTIPEPSTLLLGAMASVGLLARRGRRKS